MIKEDIVVYVIPGNPIPLARARINHKSMYDSQRNEKLVARVNLRNQHEDKPLFTGPLLLDITFYMPIVKSRAKQYDKILNTYDFYKPDLSNLIKYVEDVANEILYDDDCLIAKINAKKIYGEPRTEFTITSLK